MNQIIRKCKNEYFIAFLWNLLLAIITFGFFLIKENGLFSLSYDFNSQMIPFHKLLLDTIHNNSGLWNWNIDLGTDIVQTMGYYGLGSPFFWIFSWCHGKNILYIIGWEYILKYAIAGLASYCWFRQYVNKKELALMGSVLYAFSGFQTVNLLFFIFHDAVALFPFMLLALDDLVQNDKKCWFSFAVFINAVVNYYCFIGEVIFLILYFIIRYLFSDRNKLRKIGRCFIEGFIGLGMAAVIFIPSIWGVLQNSRVSDGILWSSFFETSRREMIQYLWHFIVPSEMCMDRSCIYAEDWTSRSAYLPMIGVTFELAYFLKRNKRDWLKRFLFVMTILMIFPLGNGLFSLFTTNYCRWFYMPVLFMILSSIKVMDNWKTYPVLISTVIMLMVTIGQYIIFHWWNSNRFEIILNEQRYTTISFMAFIGIVIVFLCGMLVDKERIRNIFLLCGVSAFAIITTSYTCNLYQHFDQNDSFSYEDKLELLESAQADLNGNCRVLTTEDNISMLGGFKGINSFISTISGSIPEFWSSLGLKKVIFSPEGPAGTNELLSVKYYLTKEELASEQLIREYQNGNEKYYLYQTDNSLDIGFSYDTYMLKSDFLKLNEDIRALAMLKTLVIDDDIEDEVSQYLVKEDYDVCKKLAQEDIAELVMLHKNENAYDFYTASDKFSCKIDVSDSKYMFLSVPYNKGWSAKVNGASVDILNINGLMAIPVEAGCNVVEFKYVNHIFIYSQIISMFFVVAWIAFLIKSKKGKE